MKVHYITSKLKHCCNHTYLYAITYVSVYVYVCVACNLPCKQYLCICFFTILLHTCCLYYHLTLAREIYLHMCIEVTNKYVLVLNCFAPEEKSTIYLNYYLLRALYTYVYTKGLHAYKRLKQRTRRKW